MCIDIARRLAVTIFAATLLTSSAACTYKGAEADRATAQGQPTTLEQPSDPGPSPGASSPVSVPESSVNAPAASDGGGDHGIPSTGVGDAPEPSDGGGEHPGFEIPAAVPEVTVDLAPQSETAVTYLRPAQAFSPELEVWEIDGADVHFRSYNCAGGLTHEVYATLVDNGDLTVTARWEGDAPGELVGWSASSESVLQIDERTLRPVPGGSDTIASTRTELELQDYAGMCQDAGKTLAAFIL